MSIKRVLPFPAGALSVAAVVSLLTACAPAQRISFSDLEKMQASPSLTIKKDIDMVRLEGFLPSFEQVDRVYQQTASMFDASVIINDIIIDASVAEAQWLEPVLATVEGVSHIDDFSVSAANGQMLVGGSVDNADRADSIASMASSLAGLDLAVTSNLLVPDAPIDYENIDLNALLGAESPIETEFQVETELPFTNDLFAVSDVPVAMGTAVEIEAYSGAEVPGEAEILVEAEFLADVEVPTYSATSVEAESLFNTGVVAEAESLFQSDAPIEAELPVINEIVVEGEALEVTPALLIEQPAVAVVSPVISDVATAVRVMPVPEAAIEPSVNLGAASNDLIESGEIVDAVVQEIVVADPVLPAATIVQQPVEQPVTVATILQDIDTDADGIPDIDDQCVSRPGYPVKSDGCQLLEGYLDNVKFTDQTTSLDAGSLYELDEIAGTMQSYPETRIAVISYAEGESGIQRAMARKRAFLITSYLEGLGVEKSRLKTYALPSQPDAADRIMIREID